MKLVIATHSNLIYAELDAQFNLLSSRSVATGYFYGIATNIENGEICVYRGGSDVSDENDKVIQSYRLGENSDTNLHYISEFRLPSQTGAVHQICAFKGGLLVVNTKYNSVLLIDGAGNRKHEYHVNDFNGDVNHVNSVFLLDNYIVLLLHNSGRGVSELCWLTYCESGGFSQEKILKLWDERCHNIFSDGKNIVYNASVSSNMVKYCISTNQKSLLRLTNHTKGLAVSNRHYFVGCSDYASRDMRGKSSGNIVVVDRDTFSIVSVVPVVLDNGESEIGNINDIRILEPHDFGSHYDSKSRFDINCLDAIKASLFDKSIIQSKIYIMNKLRAFKKSVGR